MWLSWLTDRGVDVLAARRTHVELWVFQQQGKGIANSTINRRLSALSGFYRHCAAHDLVPEIPTAGVHRAEVDPDHTTTISLDRDEARALLAAAEADHGIQRLRSVAAVKLFLNNALRVDELCAADVTDLGHDRGHRTLNIVRKGGRKDRIPVAPATVAAIEAYLAERADLAGIPITQLTGPLLATESGGRLTQWHLWRLIRRLANAAGIPSWDHLSPHSLRHTSITAALDSGANLRDVQDFAGHRDPRITRRYDHSRDNLDRNPTYAVAAWLA